MRPLPAGTLTLLFSDIEGSTTAVKRLGAQWAEALDAQRRILRSVFVAHHGYEIDGQGDSFFVVFTSARQALRAATTAQRRLHQHRWPDSVPLRVRIGIHTGEPESHDDGYIGIDVHRAARIAATAHGGQIVISESTHQLVSEANEALTERDLGWHRLKDLGEPEHLYDIVTPGIPADFPPLRSVGSLANLPTFGTVLVGRNVELAELLALFQRAEARLVTLTGTGGSGKTRLALAVAASLADRFPSGVFFTPLHTVDRAALMWAAIAEAVGATRDKDDRPEERSLGFLFDRKALLLLDNLEQIPDADVVVSRLLSSAPDLKILATSRRPLHLVAEHEYPVHPLELPGLHVVDRRDAERAAAVELFVRRAQMVNPWFALTEPNTPDVVKLCRRLDGLPLAIELAAARSRLLGPRALLGRIDDTLGVGVTASDRVDRHRTLGRTIAWSYDLLDPADQTTFRRLGVFSRSIDMAALETVVEVEEADPLEVVSRLIDVNLVQATEGREGEPRVFLLQTIRSFARRKMKLVGEWEEMRLRHARWCLQVATEISDTLHGPNQMGALDRMHAVEEDIRTALDWCLRPASEVGRERTELGYAFISQMYDYWHRFGYVAEGRGWQERAIAIAEGEDSPGLVDALHGMAVLELQQDDVSNATAALEKAVEIAQRLGDLEREAREANSLAVARRSVGDTAGAQHLLERSIALAREVGDKKLESPALSNMVVILLDLEDYPAAVSTARQAIAVDQAHQDTWGIAINQTNLGMALLRAEGPEVAYRHLVATAPDSVALGDPELSTAVIEMLAAALAELGDAEHAALLLGTADAQRAQIGMPRSKPDQAYCDRSMAVAMPAISEQDWAALHARGAGLTINEALDIALTAQSANRSSPVI